MPLTLRVIGRRAQVLGDRAEHTFGPQGGRIGRAAANDWVLPDPERFVSSHHALITVVNGRFHLLDTSSNGTFVNGARTAVGRQGVHVLEPGDQLAIGGYDIVVTSEAAVSESTAAPTPLSDNKPSYEFVSHDALLHFMRGAGIDLQGGLDADAARLLGQAGLLLRELTTGLVALARERRTKHPTDADLATSRLDLRRDPLVVAASVEEALTLFLGTDQRRLVPAVDSVRAAYQTLDVERRQLNDAGRAASAAILQRLSPTEVEQRVGRAEDPAAAARCWQQYCALYARLAGADGQPQTWDDDLQSALRELNTPSD
jgi:predicted component of type VI protein secretion system